MTACMHAQSLQSCPTLCDPMDCSPSGYSVPENLQARILECVAMPDSGIESRSPTSPALQTDSLWLCYPGKPS